jgi:Xaa-Pro aminopeptidase
MDYARRRRELMSQLQGGALVLATAPERTRSNDTQFRYRPSSDFLYLTGFAEPNAVLVLTPGANAEVTLFVRPRDEAKEIWDGHRFGPEGAVEKFGADQGFDIAELDSKLPELIADRERVYFPWSDDTEIDQRVMKAMRSLGASRKKPSRAPELIGDPTELIHRMRMYKDPDELALMTRAAEISAHAHVEAMKATAPGRYEYEIEAIIEHFYRQHGAYGPAYTNIVAGGPGACILHYVENDKRLRDGDLLLVDSGCEFDWYAADITRTWPVGTSFSGPQREIYEAVLDSQIAAIDSARIGMTNHDLQAATIRRLTQNMIDIGLMSGELDELVETEAFKAYYMHGVGHYLGMDVHDVGVYYVEEEVGLPFEKNAVITVEPGIYVPVNDESAPEQFRGIGVRIEDDVVITSGDPLVLTGDVPKTVEEIEALRREHG